MYASPQAHDAGLRSYRLCKIMYFSITIQIKLKIYFPRLLSMSLYRMEATFTICCNKIFYYFCNVIVAMAKTAEAIFK